MHAYADVHVCTQAHMHVPAAFCFSSPYGWIEAGTHRSPPSPWTLLHVTGNGALCRSGQSQVVCSQKLFSLTPRGDGGALGALSHKGKSKFLMQQ